ncbi:hypothetical protein R3W88_020643 [Solanum pinnatisectum]|uniref:Class II aldolase/adducin N-terminal domain-containing protein n=1 Tax=Solanum pinnatisectum TaxID=50273 RepID=A0AAV9KNG1_9SOLN|nr:hypothetical protein R3W88_020643 [Solanum pinnatisectum]
MLNAGAVIHSHGMESCLVTMLNPLAKEFQFLLSRTLHMKAYRELTESLTEAIKAYPRTTAVLVCNHDIYVWGDSCISAKTQSECYHYLFDAAIKLHQLGIDRTTATHAPVQNAKAGTLAQMAA